MIHKITFVDKDTMTNWLDAWCDGDKYAFPWGLYLIREDNCLVACDNSSGDAWCEDFKTMDEAINWLIGE